MCTYIYHISSFKISKSSNNLNNLHSLELETLWNLNILPINFYSILLEKTTFTFAEHLSQRPYPCRSSSRIFQADWFKKNVEGVYANLTNHCHILFDYSYFSTKFFFSKNSTSDTSQLRKLLRNKTRVRKCHKTEGFCLMFQWILRIDWRSSMALAHGLNYEETSNKKSDPMSSEVQDHLYVRPSRYSLHNFIEKKNSA